MKKNLISTILVLMSTTLCFAQNTLMAVLSHETDVQMFYGSSALKSAVEAAVSGDVITLSAGQFSPCNNITKGITIRGIGADGDNTTQIREYGTSYGYINISVPESDINNLTIEGLVLSSDVTIYGSSKGLIAKCKTGKIVFNSEASANLKMVNCNVTTLTLTSSSNLRMSNCIVNDLTNAKGSASKADLFNCLVTKNYYTSSGAAYGCSFVNCIFSDTAGGSYSYNFQADASAMNCLFVQNESLSGEGTRIDCYSATVPEVFASYENKLVNARYDIYGIVPTTSQLSEEAKTKYIGTDGKEVGVYGGQYPYDLTPTYPRITKLNVAKQASADNKLSVDIEVSANE